MKDHRGGVAGHGPDHAHLVGTRVGELRLHSSKEVAVGIVQTWRFGGTRAAVGHDEVGASSGRRKWVDAADLRSGKVEGQSRKEQELHGDDGYFRGWWRIFPK